MAVNVEWYLKGRVLRVTGCVTLVDLQERDRQIFQFLDEDGQSPGVHLFLDYSTLTAEERALFLDSFREYAESVFARSDPSARRVSTHYLLGWVVGIGAPETRYIGQALARVGGFRRHECESVAAAIEFLKSVDDSLPADLRGPI